MTENSSVDSATVFRASDEFVDTGYRRITPWAFVAFLAGLASVLALLAPLFWILPLAAIVCGGAALRAIRAQEDVLGGRKLALSGIVLATVLLSSAVTSHYIHAQMVYAHAQVHANRWFELVKARQFEAAHQLRLPHLSRATPGADLARAFEKSDQQAMLAAFLREPAVEKIARLGPDARLTFLSNRFVTRETPTMDAVGLRYRLDSANGDERPEIVEIDFSRESFPVANESHWTVRRVALLPDAA